METRTQWWWRRWLPYLAAGLLVVALASGWVAASELNSWKYSNRPDTGAARVNEALGQLEAATQADGSLSPDSEAFKGLTRGVPYLGSVLLVDADGRVLYRQMPRKAGHLSGLTTAHLQRVLAAVPPDSLTAGQRLLLLSADAVLAEGEHADVYNYVARLLVDEQGNPLGAVAVAYDRNTSSPSSAYMATLPLSLVSLLLYWLSLPLWVLLDARARGEGRPWLWAALALAGNLLGVLTYVLVRQPVRRPCPACHQLLEEGWLYCPHCAASVGVEGAE